MEPGALLFCKHSVTLTDSSGWKSFLGSTPAGCFFILLEAPTKCDEWSMIKVVTEGGKVGWCKRAYLEIVQDPS